LEKVEKMSHSTRLQNLTHLDIIKIGCGFEAELRAELKKENEIELGRLKDLMRIENEKEIEKLNLKLAQQQQNHNQEIRDQEEDFLIRLEEEKEKYFEEMKPYIEEEKLKARIDEKRMTEIESEKRRSTQMQGHAIELLRLKQSHQGEIEALSAGQKIELSRAQQEMNSELDAAKREIGKMKFNEMKQQDYTEEMIADVRRNLLENHQMATRDLVATFETEKFGLQQQIKTLDNSLKEKETELDLANENNQNQKNLFNKLKKQFEEYVLRTRPELTPGQIDFMFEF
jgi:hypothetical protein